MTYATPLSPASAGYLDALAEQLSDFPADERAEILGDVEASLLEAADATPETLYAQFGSPTAFAAELRAAAGVARQTTVAPPRGPSLLDRLRVATRGRRVQRTIGVLARVEPIWWVVRAYLIVTGAALLFGAGWSVSHPYLPRIGNTGWTIAAFTTALVVSIAAGLSPRARRLLLVADLVAVIALTPVAADLVRHAAPTRYVYVSVPSSASPGLNVSGAPVLNIYPYTRAGALLHDVLLYDQNGAPLIVGSPLVADPDRRLLRTPRGVAIFNSFPIRYYDPGTAKVTHPNAGPRIRVPRMLTP